MESFKKYELYFYVFFRVLVGSLFLQHGLQKIFGLFGGPKVAVLNLFLAAGIIEFVGGVLITLGLYTRIAALFGMADMLGAYFIAHFPHGWIPIQNKGELALLYLACFLIIHIHGAKSLSLDSLWFNSKRK